MSGSMPQHTRRAIRRLFVDTCFLSRYSAFFRRSKLHETKVRSLDEALTDTVPEMRSMTKGWALKDLGPSVGSESGNSMWLVLSLSCLSPDVMSNLGLGIRGPPCERKTWRSWRWKGRLAGSNVRHFSIFFSDYLLSA